MSLTPLVILGFCFGLFQLLQGLWKAEVAEETRLGFHSLAPRTR